MFNFRKSSLSWKQQMSKMFQNEKKVRKNGSVEKARFDFYSTGGTTDYQSDIEDDKSFGLCEKVVVKKMINLIYGYDKL